MLKNLKIGTRLVLGFGILLVFMMIVGLYGITVMQNMQEQIQEIAQEDMIEVEKANQLIDNINIMARGLRNIILDQDKKFQEDELKRIAGCQAKIDELFITLGNALTDEDGSARVKQGLQSRSAYVKNSEEYISMVKAGQIDEATKMLFGELREAQRKYFEAVEELVEYKSNEAQDEAQEMADKASRATMTIAGILAVSVLLSVLLVFFTVRSITGPVRKTSFLAEAMASGDFTNKLDIDQKDEIGLMALSLNSMVDQLGSMVRDIVGGVRTLTVSSGEMAGISSQLSAAATNTSGKAATVATATEEMSANFHSVTAAMEQSASNVQMVAAAAEEMTATVSEIAQNADKARSITENAVNQSRQASIKMAALGESSRNIGRVTEMITAISEQTNLLALNATIEAARAGEAGRGFAVVANEIKELSRQTSTATGDIRKQIEEMQNTAAMSMKDIESISEIISEINSVVTGIASAVEEQSSTTSDIAGNISQASLGIAEVNENVAQASSVISDITHDIALINQQSSQVGDGSSHVQESARGLSELAVRLDMLVKQFKV